MSMRPQDHTLDLLTATILLQGVMCLRVHGCRLVVLFFGLSHGSYLINFAISIWIQLSDILLAHPTVQFNVGNLAN